MRNFLSWFSEAWSFFNIVFSIVHLVNDVFKPVFKFFAEWREEVINKNFHVLFRFVIVDSYFEVLWVGFLNCLNDAMRLTLYFNLRKFWLGYKLSNVLLNHNCRLCQYFWTDLNFSYCFFVIIKLNVKIVLILRSCPVHSWSWDLVHDFISTYSSLSVFEKHRSFS